MKRTLNFTGRKKIPRACIGIEVRRQESHVYFVATLDLSPCELLRDANVFVEAYRNAAYMRFPFGTVGSPRSPSETGLKQLEGSDSVLFRVKVVGADGVLLAEADRIRPEAPEEREHPGRPLLPVRSAELGDELWQLEYADDQPVLLVNKRIPTRTTFVRSEAFATLAWPGILRAILTRISTVDSDYDADDPESWQARWMKFAERLAPSGRAGQADGDTDDQSAWINQVVKRFCGRQQLYDRYRQAFISEPPEE